jgi:hypothetical protein
VRRSSAPQGARIPSGVEVRGRIGLAMITSLKHRTEASANAVLATLDGVRVVVAAPSCRPTWASSCAAAASTKARA